MCHGRQAAAAKPGPHPHRLRDRTRTGRQPGRTEPVRSSSAPKCEQGQFRICGQLTRESRPRASPGKGIRRDNSKVSGAEPPSELRERGGAYGTGPVHPACKRPPLRAQVSGGPRLHRSRTACFQPGEDLDTRGQPAANGVEGHLNVETCLAVPAREFEMSDGLPKQLAIGTSQSATASARTRSRRSGRRDVSGTTYGQHEFHPCTSHRFVGTPSRLLKSGRHGCSRARTISCHSRSESPTRNADVCRGTGPRHTSTRRGSGTPWRSCRDGGRGPARLSGSTASTGSGRPTRRRPARRPCRRRKSRLGRGRPSAGVQRAMRRHLDSAPRPRAFATSSGD